MGFRFLPDLPPETKDIWTVCDGWHADAHGVYRTGYLAASYLVTGLTRQFGNMKCLPYGTTGANSNIVALCGPTVSPLASGAAYIYNGATWNDRTGGTNVVIDSANESTAQFGNITLVGTAGNGIFFRDATTANNFAAVAGSPNCGVLLVTAFNMAVAISTTSDAWATSDASDYTNWATLEAASGNLRHTSGNNTAGVRFGNDVIVFKRKGIYRGTYTGGVVKWKWDLIHSTLGAWGAGCAINVNDVIYFYGDNGFWSFDGSAFKRLDSYGMRKSLLTHMARPTTSSHYVNAKLAFDSINSRIYFFQFGGFVNGGAQRSAPTPAHYSFQVESEQWGYQSQVKDGGTDNYECVVDGFEVTPFNAAWDKNTTIALFSSTNNDIRSITTEFNGSNVGGSFVPKLRTYRLGARDGITTVSRFYPGWTLSDGAGSDLSAASTAYAFLYTSTAPTKAETFTGTTVTLTTDEYRADYVLGARFQSIQLHMSAAAAIDGGTFDAKGAGVN